MTVLWGRLVSGLLEAPGYGSILLVSAYLVAGANLDEQNLGILERLGRVLTSSTHPYIVGGDFQVSPGTMVTIDFTQVVGATLVTASDGLGTCKSSRGVVFLPLITSWLSNALLGPLVRLAPAWR